MHVSATQDRSVELAALKAARRLDEQRLLGVSGILMVRPSLEPQAPNVLPLPLELSLVLVCVQREHFVE